MASTTSHISNESISGSANPSTGEETHEDARELLRFGTSILNGVTLHFDDISMLVDPQVLNICPVFSAALNSDRNGKKCTEITIEKYSKKAVVQMLWHLYVGDEDTFDQSNFYSKLSEEDLSETMDDLRWSIEVFCLADEYQLPILRSKAQANIMSIRRRAIQLNDSFLASMIRVNVLNIYNDNWFLHMGMLDELAKQCLEYECVREWHHLGFFAKVDGVWVANLEEYERLVKRLNVFDPGMIPIPMDRGQPKSEVDKWIR